ncbi:MAG TPA: hypothetical protein VMT19_08615 [Thermoanaerobaculaceae bacterium]|nr:hypothetical protein [Thermoanaerobaculaceae bacterium]
MTTITTTCEGCGRQLAVPDRYQGRELKCPTCGRPFRAEAPAPQPAAPPPAPYVEAPTVPTLVRPPFEEAPFQAQEPAATAAVPADVGETATVFWRVRRIGVLSLAALSALLHAVLGLVAGIVVAVVLGTPAAQAIPFPHGPLLGVLAVVLLPLVYAVIGFVAGGVTAVVYNVAARLTGGVRLLLE